MRDPVSSLHLAGLSLSACGTRRLTAERQTRTPSFQIRSAFRRHGPIPAAVPPDRPGPFALAIAVRADSLAGNAPPRTIDGLAGNDTLTGGSRDSSDVLAGGEADIDVLKGGAGNDYRVGGAGTDIADLPDGTAGVNVQLAGGRYTVNLSGAGLGTDTLEGIDGIIGSGFNDTLIGTDGDGEDEDGPVFANHLDGGAGNDSIDGKTGSDLLSGGTGDDRLIGGVWDEDDGIQFEADGQSRPSGTIDDRLYGGAGNDAIHGDDISGNSTQGGGEGNDTIVAGNGNDSIDGGAGIDTITGGAAMPRLPMSGSRSRAGTAWRLSARAPNSRNEEQIPAWSGIGFTTRARAMIGTPGRNNIVLSALRAAMAEP